MVGDLIAALWVFVLGASVFGTVASATMVYLRLRAERRLRDQLMQHLERHAVGGLADLVGRDGPLTAEELEQARAIINDLVNRNLSAEDRQRIAQALHQPSSVGRRRYITKVLDRLRQCSISGHHEVAQTH